MVQVIRRLLSVTLLASMLAILGGMAGLEVAAASARPVSAGSSPGQPPGGGVKVLGEKFDGFCVKNFQPNSDVTVTNTLTGQSVTIHTDAKGDGCAQVPLRRACNAVPQRIVASGIGNDGKPATVSATVVAPATPSLCTAVAAAHGSIGGSSNSGGTLPFTGADIALMVAVALILLGAGTTTVIVVRRRRQLTV